MSPNPQGLLIDILAHKVVSLNFYVEYLERRLADAEKRYIKC